MKKKTVRNISDSPQALEGIGVVQPKEEVKVPSNFHNGNFEEVNKGRKKSDTIINEDKK